MRAQHQHAPASRARWTPSSSTTARRARQLERALDGGGGVPEKKRSVAVPYVRGATGKARAPIMPSGARTRRALAGWRSGRAKTADDTAGSSGRRSRRRARKRPSRSSPRRKAISNASAARGWTCSARSRRVQSCTASPIPRNGNRALPDQPLRQTRGQADGHQRRRATQSATSAMPPAGGARRRLAHGAPWSRAERGAAQQQNDAATTSSAPVTSTGSVRPRSGATRSGQASGVRQQVHHASSPRPARAQAAAARWPSPRERPMFMKSSTGSGVAAEDAGDGASTPAA